jgi:RNA polymerase sigma factor (sigma-70 family)
VTGGAATIEGLLRELAPQALAAVARRGGSFADAEDAVQEALIKASERWPQGGVPERPLGWLIRVASREVIGRHRSDSARRRREGLSASWRIAGPDPAPERDDSLILLFLCCREDLSPAAAIPLTLRALGGLTTGEIADAFLVKETTMGQRISRAKATIASSPEPFRLPTDETYARRLRTVLHVLYLMFNEGHAASRGEELGRPDLVAEAIRLVRMVHEARPDDPEVGGLLALLLLTEARRPARTGPRGAFVPLAEQNRMLWDRSLIREGIEVVTRSLGQHRPGPYQLQAAIAAVHDQAPTYERTNWEQVVRLYEALESVAPSPVVTVNRAVAVGMRRGPDAGLEVLVGAADALDGHHRYHAVRAHLLELDGRTEEAMREYDAAIQRVTNERERTHLRLRRAQMLGEVDRSTASPEPP